MTLRWRIALILAAVALAVGAFAAIASYLRTESQLRSGIDDTLTSAAAAVNASGPDQGGRFGRGGRDGDGPGNDSGCPVAGAFETASAAQLVSPTGAVTPCITGGPTLPVEGDDRSSAPGAVDLRTVDIDGQSYRLLSTPWHGGGTLQIARSLSESDGVLSRLRFQLAAVVGIATAAAAGLGWAVATRLVRPIVRLRDATHRIATTHDLSTPIDVEGPGEVGNLASSFSTMVAEVGRSQEAQRRLVSDASHEMRTPLTSLRSNVELLRQIELLPEVERREVIGDVLDDVDELSSLLGELVELASDLAAAEPEEPVRVGDLARTVACDGAGNSEAEPVGLLGLVDGELRRGIGLEALIGDRPATPGRSTERPRRQAFFGPFERSQTIAEVGGDRVVGGLGGEELAGVTGAVMGVSRFSVGAAFRIGVAEELLNPCSLGVQQLPCPLLVHVSAPCRDDRGRSGIGDGGAAPAAVILTSVATPELNNRHRDTLEKIFRHPASGNLDWRHVVSLLDAVGTVEEDGANVKVTLGGETQMLRRPKGKDIDTQMVVDLRRMLTEAGLEPPAGGS